MKFAPGTIVTAQGGSTETIIGIVLNQYEYGVIVAWISDTRGAFFCDEDPSDVNVAALDQRHDITDPLIDHVDIATSLDRLWSLRKF